MGGGLAGSLVAWRLRHCRPDVTLALIEKDSHLGGHHTWSFHSTDLTDEALDWLSPFIDRHWSAQSVHFPSYDRILTTGYHSVTSEKLAACLGPLSAGMIRMGQPVDELARDGVKFRDGRSLSAGAVIDARGGRESDALSIGYQKFVGQFLALEAPHGLSEPIIMDASVEQLDGYRFIYVLPFSETTLLVEDTRYTDSGDLHRDSYRQGIRDYCAKRQWSIKSVTKEEEGVLPIALAGDFDGYLAQQPPGIALAGMRAGLFHPLTGYSLPDAVRLADIIAGADDLSGAALSELTRSYAKKIWGDRAYYRLLSRMLFGAARPHLRYKVLERFYKMPQKLIERLYAGVSTPGDQMRILAGKPPVPVLKAIKCINETAWHRRPRSEWK